MSEKVLTSFDNGGWQRNFSGEKISILDKFIHTLRSGYVSRTFGVLAERQAQFVDTNFYYREGGVDPEKVETKNDILAIQWGIGSWKASTYDEQVTIAKDQGKRYITWWIPDVASSLSVAEQVDKIYETPEVADGPLFIDKEKPRSTTRYVNFAEMELIVNRIRLNSVFHPGCYSRVNIFEDTFSAGFPDWFEDVMQWIAQYPYAPGTTTMFRTYDDFLAEWEGYLPPAVTRSSLYNDQKWRDQVLAWQFTSYGLAIMYIAPPTLPDGSPAMRSCDLNVSIPSLSEFLVKLFERTDQPPAEDCPCQEQIDLLTTRMDEQDKRLDQFVGELEKLENRINALDDGFADHEVRIQNLEDTSETDPEEPPIEPLPEFLTVVVENDAKKNCSVYYPVGHDKACEGEIPGGKPIPERKVGNYALGQMFNIYAKVQYSCVDDPETPEVKTSYGDYYMVFRGSWDGALVPCKRLKIVTL